MMQKSKMQLLRILHVQLEDNVKASTLLPDGSYCRKINTLYPVDSQRYFMENSLHKPYADPIEAPR